MVKILAFDTETNDNLNNIIQKNNKHTNILLDITKQDSLWLKYIDKWPSIIQLGYVFYDTNNPSNTKLFDKYIDLPPNIKITKETTKIHHITNNKIQQLNPKHKLKIGDAIKEFMEDVSNADVIIGHNVDFDRQMIIAEILRLSDNDDKLKQQWKQKMMDNNLFVCTMKLTKTQCNIKIKTKTKKINSAAGETKVFDKIKSPKLIEAYKHFFGYMPVNKFLHNALIDSIICLRVYCMCLKNKLDVYGTNSKLTKYINSFSPKGVNVVSLLNKKQITNNKKTKKASN